MRLYKAISRCSLLTHKHKQCKLHYLWTRCVFSKTGVWDPKFSQEVRFEIEDHWHSLIQHYDQQQSQLAFSSTCDDKQKYYALSMFPYPSGNLHLGHVRVYTISDVMARYQRSLGKVVIHPMGWDAFGLPAENAAIERGIHPKDWTYSNIEKMRKQLDVFNFSFDWNRELTTCDPSYYKWTQYIFLKMFESGLAFQKKGLVNWDPADQTVLADEQIDEHGCSWRSGAKVEKKYLKQWYLRDTSFSESLLEGLKEVNPELWQDIILLQRNWISDCQGYRFDFALEFESGQTDMPLSVYTDNLDLIYGVSHICVKVSHYLCVDFGIQPVGAVLPVYAIHPFTKERLKFVVTDEEFVYKNKDARLAIPCISKHDKETAERLNIAYHSVLDSTNRLQNSQELNGLSREGAVELVRKRALALGVGGEKISERLNDWLISRQRYWGTPIPIIHCEGCGTVPVPYADLPVQLPDTNCLISKEGHSPLAEIMTWVNVACPKCGLPAKRETDTLDTFVDSTWYFLRYLDPQNEAIPFDPQKVKQLMPVDLYVGGKEHAVLHLYFARFVSHFLHSIELLDHREPFLNLLTQGMVKGESYRVKDSGKYIPREQVDLSGERPVEAKTGAALLVDWEKMSKSKHNGINPEDVVAEYGVDSTRLCILSNVSPQSDRNWSNIVYKGVLHWQSRIWNLVTSQRKYYQSESYDKTGSLDLKELEDWEMKINNIRNHTVNNVNFQFDRTFNINTAISRLHSYVSWLLKVPPEVASKSEAFEQALADLIIMLSPMAPHFASELWVGLAEVVKYKTHQWAKSVLEQSWPRIEDDFLMPLTYRVNNVDISEVGVPYRDFDQLNERSALEVVQQDPQFQEQFSQYPIENVFLNVIKGHKAALSLIIPQFDFGVEGSSRREIVKKTKKLSKQKKRLHSLEI